MELDPGLAEAYNNLGLSYFYKGFYHEALEKFNRAVTLMPHSAGVYFNMALVYLRGFNDKRRGIYYLKESLRIDPLQSRAAMIKEVLIKLGSDGAAEK
jgi:tetratricopeptide (TPR) repeat protein